MSAELGLPKALWLKENEPETWNGAARVVDCADWAIQRLTGEAATSINTVSGKYYYDRDEGGFPVSLYQAVGVEDLLDKIPQQVLDLGVAVGELGKDAADELGLEAGTPVAEGGIDAHVGALGLGVVSPGMLATGIVKSRPCSTSCRSPARTTRWCVKIRCMRVLRRCSSPSRRRAWCRSKPFPN